MRIQSYWLLLAAVGLALASCGGGSASSPAETTGTVTSLSTTTGSPKAATTISVPSTTAPPVTSTTIGALDEAVSNFQQWVGALVEGDSERAWERMAASSQRALGSFDHFAEMSTGFAEGWGSWVAVEDPSYSLEQDAAGRTLLIVNGTIRPEGTVEQREVGIPLVREEGQLLLSPFEEFGHVAEGLEEEAAGAGGAPLPPDSGEGRRIVYANSEQRVWLVEIDGTVVDTYLVSGREGVPDSGYYEVFSKSELAFAGHDDITMTHMVRFAHGQTLDIGFHAIPNDGNGRPLQAEDELGEFRSAGCVRQSPGQAAFLYDWAEIGTKVAVLP